MNIYYLQNAPKTNEKKEQVENIKKNTTTTQQNRAQKYRTRNMKHNFACNLNTNRSNAVGDNIVIQRSFD